MASDSVAIRKRTQILKANRTMFIWIAAAAALVGVAVVVSIFLGQQIIYNEKVLAAKLKTANTLDDNIKAVDGLKEEIRVLDTNLNLAQVKANPDDQTLQVVLDALPSEANSLALGASLQNKLLAGVPGLDENIASLQVNSVSSMADDVVVDESASGSDGQSVSMYSIGFSFTVSGTQSALKILLENLEKSIRTIDINSIHMETQSNNKILLSVDAKAYYEPARTLELKEETVPR